MSMIRYVFNDTKVLPIKNIDKLNAQAIGEELAQIREANGGDVPADELVRRAQDRHNPAHQAFEWDDRLAAHSHRLQQARMIIRSIVSHPVHEPDKATPAFVSIRSDKGGVAYRSMSDVVESPRLQEIVLAQAERDLLAFQARFRRFQEIFDAVEPVLKTVRALREKETEKS